MSKPQDRFEELFQWNLDKYHPQLIRCRKRYFSYGQTIKDAPFGVRALVADIWTTILLIMEEAKGNLVIDRMATLEEDIHQKIDVWSQYGDEILPEQFKIRDKYLDFNCVRFQPCHGIGHEKTEDGRDYVCLRDQTTHYHRSAIWLQGRFRRIHRVRSDEFWEKVQQLDSDWGQKPLSASNRTWRRESDGSEVKWHKNEGEDFHKYNFYIPPESFKTLETEEISLKQCHLMLKFYKWAWDHVRDTYI